MVCPLLVRERTQPGQKAKEEAVEMQAVCTKAKWGQRAGRRRKSALVTRWDGLHALRPVSSAPSANSLSISASGPELHSHHCQPQA